MAFTNPYASTHPAVGQLFGAEFAVEQANQAGQQADKNRELARQQVAAQERLAQAQLAGQQQQAQQADLFRMNQSKQVDRQLDIDEKYKNTLGARTGVRTAAETDEANRMSEGIASQLNGSYQTKLTVANAALDKKYEDDVKALGSWNFGLPGNTAKSAAKLKVDYDAAKSILPDTIFNQLHDIGTKYYPAGTYGADPVGRKFLPVRISGGTAAQPGASPVPFNMGTPPPPGAGVGATPSPVVPDPNAQIVVAPPPRRQIDLGAATDLTELTGGAPPAFRAAATGIGAALGFSDTPNPERAVAAPPVAAPPCSNPCSWRVARNVQ